MWSSRTICLNCHRQEPSSCCTQLNELTKNLKAVNDELASQKSKSDTLFKELSQLTPQLKDMESRVCFLRLQVDIERASSGVWRTDVAVLVQDRHGEPLAAHKFILVSIRMKLVAYVSFCVLKCATAYSRLFNSQSLAS